MEINENTPVDTETTYLDATPEGMEAFYAGLSNDDVEMPEPTSTDDTVKESNDQADQPETGVSKQDTGKDYAIRYKGKDETLHLTDEEVIKELQKARDYADVRKERDELKASSAKAKDMEAIFAHFARENGMEPDEYFSYCKAQTEEPALLEAIKAAHPEISDATARELLILQKEKKAREEAEKADAADKAAIQADMDALHAEYPDADIDHLPDEVAKMIADGMKPVEAMRIHDNREMRKKITDLTDTISALTKEKENRQKAPGRLKNNGSDEGMSPFAKGFFGGG